jgi:pyruvate-formate lyase-activating enzyme
VSSTVALRTDALMQLRTIALERPLHIWGAGNQGRGLCRALQRHGIALKGFVDKSALLHESGALGLPVSVPSEFLAHVTSTVPRPFVIIASFFFEQEIATACSAAGLVEDEDYLSYTAIKPFDWAVDISGVCNLRCLSCPRATRREHAQHEGFMSAQVFAQVLDKIQREDPLAGSMQLYQWGEPLLNPQVAEIIRFANSRGMQTAVSSNLNNARNLADAVKAQPSWFRISVSGWGSNYERTHTGGAWEAFHGNFLSLADLRRDHNPDMKTEVYYHLYKHNQGDDLRRVRDLCAEAGFEFHPVNAYVISLDDVLRHLEGGKLPDTARQASEMLAISLEQGMAGAREQQGEECLTLRCVSVNWDLSVSNCMMFYDADENRAAADFLSTPLAEIVERRKSASLCRRCRKQALHRYCSYYATAPVPGATSV